MSTCPYIFKNNSSKNKGSVCGRSIRGGAPFCWQHKASGLKQMKEEPKKSNKVKDFKEEPKKPKQVKDFKEIIVDIESESLSDIQEPEIEEIKVNKSKTTPFTQLKNTSSPKKKKYSSSSSSSSESYSSYSLNSSEESTEESYSL